MTINVNVYPNGLGASLGDTVVTASQFFTSSNRILYVDNSSDNASDINGGDNEDYPLSTLAAALALYSAGDIIVLGAGHDETLAANQTVSNRVTIVGIGSSGGDPTATLRVGVFYLAMAGAYSELRNVKVVSATTATQNVLMSGDGCAAIGCRFECDDDTLGGALKFTGASGRVSNCTFISTASDSIPEYGLVDATTTRLVVENTTFDEGELGFASYACELGAGGATLTQVDNVSLLRGAEIICGVDNGWIGVGTATGAARVLFASFG